MTCSRQVRLGQVSRGTTQDLVLPLEQPDPFLGVAPLGDVFDRDTGMVPVGDVGLLQPAGLPPLWLTLGRVASQAASAAAGWTTEPAPHRASRVPA